MRASPVSAAPQKRAKHWEVGSAVRALLGEVISGDGIVVVDQGPELLVGLCDGVGHGHAAAHAAHTFCRTVREVAAEPIERIMDACHTALAGKRGVAAMLVRFNAPRGEGEFAGIGNITARHLERGARDWSLLAGRRGVLGSSFRASMVTRFDFAPGDVLVAHTDGVSSRARAPHLAYPSAQGMADAFLAAHAKPHDDASCVVVRRPLRASMLPPARS
jgi:negative regulator of sigma-B (phosphoserine phosphatase)